MFLLLWYSPGACSPTRDAWSIDFWAVHVAPKLAARADSGSIAIVSLLAHHGRYGQAWHQTAWSRPTWAEIGIWEDSGAWCWNTSQDQVRWHQGLHKLSIIDCSSVSLLSLGLQLIDVPSYLVLQVYPGIERLTREGANFVDGRSEDFDALIFATGYRSNVPSWLKV